jgi:Thioredoxin like C-terminal domain
VEVGLPDIYLPEFPKRTQWINVPFIATGTLLGRSAPLVWFWDYCSLNALRALPYFEEWHRRYADAGLRVIGVHSPQFEFARDPELVADAVRRLGIEFAVALDSDFEIWRLYGNKVWPALYLWDRRAKLRHYHFGEGLYNETEAAIQNALREIDARAEMPALMAPIRLTDGAGAVVKAPTPHSYMAEDRSARPVSSGEVLRIRYQGATAAAVLDGDTTAELEVDGELRRIIRIQGPRLYKLVESGRHEDHELKLRFRGEAQAYAFSFAPGPA